MALLLGVDTGGTYTDAVLMRDEAEVIASAKSLTTKQDLALGIGAAVAAVLDQSGVDPAQISMASLSTTLATNALVEDQGGRVALVYIGFSQNDLDAHGLSDALKGDPVIVLQGGHNHAGTQAHPLDLGGLDSFLDTCHDVSAFAVAAQFATRNPAHEQAAAQRIHDKLGVPVSASHHLSAKLNGPKRAMTALLNARLLGMIDGLINSAERTLTDLGIAAPLMVVRGDGALISADVARARPIETILSGPAASIVGASWLTNVKDALVSDIGGTTTDIAVLKDGKPAIDPMGAQVGPYRTMVEAVAMRTHGLGGDSEVHFITEGLKGGVRLGPRRVLPVALIAQDAPETVHKALDQQLRSPLPGEHDGRFVKRVTGQDASGLAERDAALLERIGDQVQPLGDVLRNRMEAQSLKRLTERGIVQLAGVTPSDASHVLERTAQWDRDAAQKAMQLLGRKRTGAGTVLASDPVVMAQIIVDQLTRQTQLALLESAFAEDAEDFGQAPAELARHALTQRGLNAHRGLLRLDTALNVPLVGLGASAASYYPAVGAALRCEAILPAYGGVANAIGAVVGRVTIRREAVITTPSEGLYRVHFQDGPEDFSDQATALATLEHHLRESAKHDAAQAGAQDIQVTCSHDIKQAAVENRLVFVEATLCAEASGRARITASDT